MKTKAVMLDAVRRWFKNHNYLEAQGPTIVPIGGGNYSFEVSYFDRKAYLTQGSQPYMEVLMANLGKVYTLAPVFRAEKAETHRHLAEYWRIEVAMPYCDLNDIIQSLEQLVSYICQSLLEEAEKQNSIICDVEHLQKVRAPFRRISYNEVIEMLKKDGFDVEWGTVLDVYLEKHLSVRFDQPFFISEFPLGIETFFYRSIPGKPELTFSTDLFAPDGYGEIATGGQPVTEKEELKKRMDEEKIEPSSQEWHMRLKGMCSVPYSGFAIGVERLTQWVCKLEKIEDASAFPRSAGNVYP